MSTRGRGRTRGAASNVGGMNTRSGKRSAAAAIVESEPQNKRADTGGARGSDDDNDSEITFRLPDGLLEEKISAAINRIVPSIVAQTAQAAVKSMSAAMTSAPQLSASGASQSPQPSTSAVTDTATPLQEAVHKQASLIAGNAATASSSGTSISSEIPLDLHLKPEMLANIAAYKYIKFGELLIKEQRDNEKMTLHLGDNTSSKQIMVNPYFNQVKIVHINQWVRAFDIYSYVMVRAHPEEASGLIQYGNLIKDMAFRGLNWANYDRQFRRLKERNPSQHPWGCTDLSLFSQNIIAQRFQGNMNTPTPPTAQNSHNQMPAQNNHNQMPFRARGGWPGSSGPSNQPPKKCFAYNKNFCRFGGSCKYAHVCSKCTGMLPHPAFKCRKQ